MGWGYLLMFGNEHQVERRWLGGVRKRLRPKISSLLYPETKVHGTCTLYTCMAQASWVYIPIDYPLYGAPRAHAAMISEQQTDRGQEAL